MPVHSQLFRYCFTQSIPPPIAPEAPPPSEYVIPIVVQRKIRRHEKPRNRKLTPQSKKNTSYQQRLRQFLHSPNPNKTNSPQASSDVPNYIPTKIRLQEFISDIYHESLLLTSTTETTSPISIHPSDSIKPDLHDSISHPTTPIVYPQPNHNDAPTPRLPQHAPTNDITLISKKLSERPIFNKYFKRYKFKRCLSTTSPVSKKK